MQSFIGSLPSAAIIEAVSEVDISAIETMILAGLASVSSALLSLVKTVAQEQLTKAEHYFEDGGNPRFRL